MYFTVAEGVVSQSSSVPRKSTVTALPQRVPTTTSRLEPPVNINITSKIPLSKIVNKPENSNEAESVKTAVESDRNSTSELNTKSKASVKCKSNDKSGKVKDKTINGCEQTVAGSSKDQLITDVSEIGLLEEADVSAFGFGGTFASDMLKSVSPIAVYKEPKKAVSIKETKQPEKAKPDDIKIRKDTFVKSKPAVKKDTKKITHEEKKKQKKTKEVPKVNNRQTFTSENPFIQKSAKVIRSPNRNQPDPPNSKMYDTVSNPFKPSKTLSRSPVAGSKVVEEEITTATDKIDSHAFLARFKNSLDTMDARSSPLPVPTFEDEPTTYFNTDMDFTAVIDTASFLKGLTQGDKVGPNIPALTLDEASPVANASNKGKAEKHEIEVKAKSDKAKPKTKDRKDGTHSEKANQAKQSKSANHVEGSDDEAGAVEVRTKKPGVFTFSVSRKDADGTRKPVPEPTSRARSKKKVGAASEAEENLKKLDEDRDMFNFGDRTPTMPLDKIVKPASHNVYDLSMNESGLIAPKSLKSLRDRLESQPAKMPEARQEEHIYYMPLKGCPDEEPAEKKPRSKSRSKSRNRDSDSDDDDWVPGKRAKSRSRGQSLGKKTDDGIEEDKKDRTRSRSRGRQTKKSDTEIEESEDIEMKKVTKTRSRSQARARKSDIVDDGEMENEKVTKSRSRSRSRPQKSEAEIEDVEVEIEKVTQSRSRSRARPKKSENDIEDVKDIDTEKVTKTRSRSRARPKKSDIENKEGKGEAQIRSCSRTRPSKSETDTDTKGLEIDESPVKVETVDRSRSKRRKLMDDDVDEDFVAIARRGRSRSRARVLTNKDTDEMEDPSNDNKSGTGKKVDQWQKSRARTRKSLKSVGDTDVKESEESHEVVQVEKSTDGSDDPLKTFDEVLESRQRSRSKRRKTYQIEEDDNKNDKNTARDMDNEISGNVSEKKALDGGKESYTRRLEQKVDNKDEVCVPESDSESDLCRTNGKRRKSTRKICSIDTEDSEQMEAESKVKPGEINSVESRTECKDIIPDSPHGMPEVTKQRCRSIRQINSKEEQSSDVFEEDSNSISNESKGTGNVNGGTNSTIKCPKTAGKSIKKSTRKKTEKKEVETKSEKTARSRIFLVRLVSFCISQTSLVTHTSYQPFKGVFLWIQLCTWINSCNGLNGNTLFLIIFFAA